ncbi:hypothetical protein [Streptomyces sedi]|uniref:hypothetical protein n=1 Tax=Streptomyces sedi TaxID=555059 RepID=UPI001FEC9108|nr:hypothetical protein [Streptomyces sedi]
MVVGEPAGDGHLAGGGGLLAGAGDSDDDAVRQSPQVVLAEADGLGAFRREASGGNDLTQQAE